MTILEQQQKQQILDGMAKAFFATAYADEAEECGEPLRGEVFDYLPEEIDPSALHAANTLYMQFEGNMGHCKLHGAYIWLHGVEQIAKQRPLDNEFELFGHYAAMQAMGHGVGFFDFDITSNIVDKVPTIEFGSYSLEKDYF